LLSLNLVEKMMTRVDLNGVWELTHRLQPAIGPAEFGAITGAEWETVPAHVPGNVELALLDAGKIADPFFASNIFSLRPLEFHEWWYQRSFNALQMQLGQKAQLVFEGLDCIATVWLNGEYVGESANALIEHRFDVTEHLKQSDENQLVVRLTSPLQAARYRQYEPGHYSVLENWESLGICNAAC
jgi:beta-mannosidase